MVSNIAAKIVNSAPFRYSAKQFNSPQGAKFVAGITLSSILLKDGIGCAYYVKQSLNNKKIPEEKRKFVAALDLVNGVLMIGTQFLMFFTLSNKKVQEKMFKGLFKKALTPENTEKIAKSVKNTLGSKFDRHAFEKALDAVKASGQDALGALVSLVGATIVAKRMIVPFISTPLAQWAKDNIINKGDKDSCEAKHLNKEIIRTTPDLIAFRNSAKHRA